MTPKIIALAVRGIVYGRGWLWPAPWARWSSFAFRPRPVDHGMIEFRWEGECCLVTFIAPQQEADIRGLLP